MTSILKQESSTDSSTNMNTFDIDQYLNLEQASPSRSPAPPGKVLSVSSPTTITPAADLLPSAARAQQLFSRPSHQYEQYRQQTGLPTGALASTYVLNDVDNYQVPSYQLGATNDLFMNTVEPDFGDFGSLPAQTPSADVDMEYGNMNADVSSFVDPNVMAGPSNMSYVQGATRQGRVWPGMHQQAALAKQQAQQQAALALQRQQAASAQAQAQAQQSGEGSSQNHEEMVEESISRLLNRMRNSSVASSVSEEGQRAGSSGHSARSKKDEEDMDEDERLLASEAGKKLTSKERRQLRNKVSARAFRSRRKEYIGQLEGELAGKASEADELRQKNSELMAENSRLTDLSRLLLSSPAFSEFLNDLAGAGSPSAIQGLMQPSTSQAPKGQHGNNAQKDVNPNHRRQSHSQVGMAMIPEESSVGPDQNNAGYPSNSGNFGNFDAQVYALPTMSDAPALDAIDFTLLNDKTASSDIALGNSSTSTKFQPSPLDLPTVDDREEKAPASDDQTELTTVSDDTDDGFSLFADQKPSSSPSQSLADDGFDILGAIPPSKAFQRLDLVIAHDASNDQSDAQETAKKSDVAFLNFQMACSTLDLLAERVERFTGRM